MSRGCWLQRGPKCVDGRLEVNLYFGRMASNKRGYRWLNGIGDGVYVGIVEVEMSRR